MEFKQNSQTENEFKCYSWIDELKKQENQLYIAPVMEIWLKNCNLFPYGNSIFTYGGLLRIQFYL